jgi:hypothetical protein
MYHDLAHPVANGCGNSRKRAQVAEDFAQLSACAGTDAATRVADLQPALEIPSDQ